MNIQARIQKLEAATLPNAKYCVCGIATFTIGEERPIVCTDCGKPFSAIFAGHGVDCKVIEPSVPDDFDLEEWERQHMTGRKVNTANLRQAPDNPEHNEDIWL